MDTTTATTPAQEEQQVVVASLLIHDRVPVEELRRRHKSIAGVVTALLGEVPADMCYMESWPPAFESLNMLFPACCSMPAVLLKPKKRRMISLMALAATRYGGGTAPATHGLTLALRAGVPVEQTANIVRRQPGVFNERELALLNACEALCQQKPSFPPHLKQQVRKFYSNITTQQMLAPAVLVGFLDKFLSGVVAEVDQRVSDLSAGIMGPDGWSAGIHGWFLDPTSEPLTQPKPTRIPTIFQVLPHAPGAAAFEGRMLAGVPSSATGLATFLKKRTGHDFAWLGNLRNAHLRRVIGGVIVKNVDPGLSIAGLHVKLLAGAVYVATVGNPHLHIACEDLCAFAGVSKDDLAKSRAFASQESTECGFENKQVRALLRLALAVSPSPSHVTQKVADEVMRSGVAPSVIVELVGWLSVLQALNRLCALVVDEN